IDEAVLARSGETALRATVPTYTGTGNRSIVWRNGSALLDCDLSLETAVKGVRLIRTTGIRLLERPVTPGAARQAQLGWPPTACVVNDEKFAAFLRGCGFPTRLSPRFVRARSGGPAGDPTLTVAFRAESDDFPGWATDLTLEWSAATAAG